MNVLITGGCGFIGSHVAERYYKEGFGVYIIDNLSTGCKANISFSAAKIFRLNIEDDQCEYVFKAAKPDIVVHLAAQTDVMASVGDPFSDASSNLLGLVNILNLSKKYGAKAFIFASSAAVYGNNEKLPLDEVQPVNPLSPYGISKAAGEFYCRKWNELYGMRTVCFRFSNVYGPRQGMSKESGVISIITQRFAENKDFTVWGDGNQTRDFIYVEDIADAIFKASRKEVNGVMNLSSNTEISINELLEIYKKKGYGKKIIHGPERKGEIARSRLDNTLAKELLGWAPKYSFEEGLSKTIDWYCTQSENARKEAAATSFSRKGLLDKYIPYFENILAFGIAAAFTYIGKLKSQEFSAIQTDYAFVYIILMSIVYGSAQGIISIILAVSLVVSMHLGFNGDVHSLIYNKYSIMTIFVYILSGLVVSYNIDNKKRKISELEASNAKINEQLANIKELYSYVSSAKDELAEQVISAGGSLGRIYKLTSELDSLETEDIYIGALKVVEEIMKASMVSIYVLNDTGTYLRLICKSNSFEFKPRNSIKLEEEKKLKQIIYRNETFINRSLIKGLPLMAAPVYYDNNPNLLICVDGVMFEELSLYHESLFKIAVALITKSFNKAKAYEDAIVNKRYFKGSKLLKPKYLEELIKSKSRGYELFGIEYTVLDVQSKSNDHTLKHKEGYALSIAGELSACIRETDHVGIDRDGNIKLVLSNTGKEISQAIIKRLEADFAIRGIA
ncbi:MAG: NAD-dependent epimerase/dehydratase family protein [Clostridia bacterium]|nr:NAD-dependent epimerase/dehydratase family protein [Clostridia bacterium]